MLNAISKDVHSLLRLHEFGKQLIGKSSQAPQRPWRESRLGHTVYRRDRLSDECRQDRG